MNKNTAPKHLLAITLSLTIFINLCHAQGKMTECSFGIGALRAINKIQINPGTKLRSYTGKSFSAEWLYNTENMPVFCIRTSANYISTFVQRKNFKINTPRISWYSIQAGPSCCLATFDNYRIGGQLLAGGAYLPYSEKNGYFFGKCFGVNLSTSVFIERDFSGFIVLKAYEFLEGLFYDKSCHHVISSTMGLSVSLAF
ncbi:MAG: hypothetical protein M0R37_11575 [Bacteroidales bacterium]|nr:hypothetical protein [Bacteroidales bacterium]